MEVFYAQARCQATHMSERTRQRLAASVVAGGVLLAYANSLQAAWVFDDHRFLAQAARQKNIEVDCVLAAKTPEGIIYEDWLARRGVKVYHRFQNDKYQRAWDLITELIDSNDYDAIYACGPELLLKRVVDLTLQKDVFCQISMERYMKCGFGICGKCCVDPLGICLCEAGPVVSNQLATQITEFGRYHRDNSGQKVYFNQ